MSQDIEAEYQAAEDCLYSNNYGEAIEAFERVISHDPEHILALNGLSRALQIINPSSSRSYQLLKKAFEVDPTDSLTLFNLGSYYFKRHSFKQAAKYYAETLKYESSHAGASYNLGVCFDQLGESDKSVEAYTRALEIDPSSTRALTNKAIALDRQGKSEEAKKLFEHALSYEDDPKIHNNLGICLKKLGDQESALRHYKKAVELDPNYSLAHYNVAVQLSEQDQLDEAIQHYQKALTLEPTNAFASLGIANTLELTGNYEEALKIYENVVQNIPEIKGVVDKIQVLKRKESDAQATKIHQEMQELKEAQNNYLEWDEETCKRKLKDREEDPRAHMQLALLLLDKKDYANAKRHLLRILEIDTQFKTEIVYDKLGDIYFKDDKDFNKARQNYLIASELMELPEI